jgi:AcrR family transcriptional regulator
VALVDTRALRRDATRTRILEVAWELAQRDGLAALSLHAIAEQVGMRAPSLYTYFPSKHAIYDAMYADGAHQLATTLAGRRAGTDARQTLRRRVRLFIEFCTADPIRYQLLFERPVPGFEPTPDSFAITVEALAGTRADLAAAGVHGERALDLFRALMTGLIALQTANDPGGKRWTRLQGAALEMFLAHHAHEASDAKQLRRTRRAAAQADTREVKS